MIDPIAELVDALEQGVKPALSWVVRWSDGGREPVAAAWDASTDTGAMLQLLSWVRLKVGRRIPMRPGAKLSMRTHANGFPVASLSYMGDEVAIAAVVTGGWRGGCDPAMVRALVRWVPALDEMLAVRR